MTALCFAEDCLYSTNFGLLLHHLELLCLVGTKVHCHDSLQTLVMP